MRNGEMRTYTADSELTALLREAVEAGEPLRVRTDGDIYEIDVRRPEKQDIWKDYDAEAVGEALRATFGIMRGVDADALIKELKAAREQDSPGRPAWYR
jgi:hypothetical protein